MTKAQNIWTNAVIKSIEDWRRTNPTPEQINLVIDSLAGNIDKLEDLGRMSVPMSHRTLDATAYIVDALFDLYSDIDEMIEEKKIKDKIDRDNENDLNDFCPKIITIGDDDQPKRGSYV
jgi:hypothetical protein